MTDALAWRNAKDVPPETDTVVVAYTRAGGMYLLRYEAGLYYDVSNNLRHPLYWMPLPPSPGPACEDCRFARQSLCIHPDSLSAFRDSPAFEARPYRDLRRTGEFCGPEGSLFEELA